MNASFVLLGTGERRYEDLWLALAARYPDRVGARIGFDEALAHLIEGGADLFLMPSRFEPCGLNQMYSLRYGTVPLVRATGGLSDTVRNFDPAHRDRHGVYVRRVLAAGAAEHPAVGAADLRGPCGLAAHAGGRHAAGFFVGRVGAGVRRRSTNGRASGVTAGHRRGI